MAKTKSSAPSRKITFGKRRNGKHKKTNGPKDKPVSKYRAQGR
jgi:hypothetical protein